MRSENLQLRALEPSDVDLLYQWENNTDTWYLSNTLAPFSRFTLEQYVLNASDDIFSAKQLRMMIDQRNGEEIISIGCIDLFDFDPTHMRAGLGIMIVEEARRKGYASEALDMIIDYTFNLLGIHQLYANVISHNSASLELFKKKHFQEIGVKKEWLRTNTGWADEFMLQLINQDS